jgi:nitrous oxidase accessory protein NosD
MLLICQKRTGRDTSHMEAFHLSKTCRKWAHQVAVVDLGVDAGGGVPPVGGGDELDAAGVVIRGHAAHGFELRQDDQCAAIHVEQGVHGARCRQEKEGGKGGHIERRRREGEWQEGYIISMCMSKGVQRSCTEKKLVI